MTNTNTVIPAKAGIQIPSSFLRTLDKRATRVERLKVSLMGERSE